MGSLAPHGRPDDRWTGVPSGFDQDGLAHSLVEASARSGERAGLDQRGRARPKRALDRGQPRRARSPVLLGAAVRRGRR